MTQLALPCHWQPAEGQGQYGERIAAGPRRALSAGCQQRCPAESSHKACCSLYSPPGPGAPCVKVFMQPAFALQVVPILTVSDAQQNRLTSLRCSTRGCERNMRGPYRIPTSTMRSKKPSTTLQGQAAPRLLSFALHAPMTMSRRSSPCSSTMPYAAFLQQHSLIISSILPALAVLLHAPIT